MRCSNCHFENLPGSAVCGRCGTSMRLAEAAIDVHPPRAGWASRWRRRILPIGRIGAAMRESWTAARCRQFGSLVFDTARQRPALLRIPVPGWSHLYLGQRARGHLFLWSFLILMVPGFLTLGTTWGSILVGLAFSVHASAALDIINQLSPEPGLRAQLTRSVVVSVALFVLFYMPLNLALRLVCDPQVINVTTGAMHEGDVVLVNRQSYRGGAPRVGDVVLYELLPRGGYGESLDRVLAGPGDHVLWDAGQLVINGEPTALRPLNPGTLPKRLDFQVPAGHYLILPSTALYLDRGVPESVWSNLSCVPRHAILGRVFLRTLPLHRMGSL